MQVRVETPNCTYVGTEKKGVRQFRGVPFASIPGRFKQPKMIANAGEVDCTKQGPICPQDELYSDSYLGVDPEVVKPIEFNVQELNCLNLMITSPASGKNLPVVIWIHGGSNCMGTAYRGVNDPFNWVKRGMETGKPFIVVSLQFRVHVFGFLPFKGVGNFGLMDQKVGIDWVCENIKYWGGSADKVSVFGQSSGSQNVYAQTCHPDRKFERAAYLSGSINEFTSRPLKDYQVLTDRLCGILNCKEDDLETLPWQDIVAAFKKTGVMVLCPVNDGVFLPLNGYDKTPKIDCVMVSDCRQDGWFFMDGLDEGVLPQLVGPHLKNKTVDTNEQVCRLLTDRIFFRGNYMAGQRFKQEGATVYTQCFDAINPLKQSLGNNHMVELFYTLQAYDLPPETLDLCHEIQDTWIKFVYFENPWPEEQFALVRESLEFKNLESLPDYRDFKSLDLEMNFEKIRGTIVGW